MSVRAYFFAAMAFVAILAAGCGGCGGDDSSSDTPIAPSTTPASGTLTKEDFIQQGDGICAEVNAAVGTIDSSTADDATKLSQEADLYSGMIERLKGLGTPDDSSGLDAVLNSGDDLVQAQQDAQLAAERGDSAALSSAEADAASALGSFQDAAASFGFEECGQAAVAPQGPATTTTPVAPAAPTTTTPAAPVTPAPAPAPAPAPPTGGGTSGGATGGGAAGGGSSGGGGTSGGVGPG